MAQQEPTISSILQELAAQYDQIVNEREILERVLEQRPSQAKDPYASIREKLRWEGVQLGWVRLGGGKLLPLRAALGGLRFRVIPSEEELAAEALSRGKLLPFVPLSQQAIRIEDAAGYPIAQPRAALANKPSFSSIHDKLSLGDWVRRSGIVLGDSILATIQSVDPLTLRLEREPAAEFRADDVLRQERELLDELAAQVARSRSNMISPDESVLPIYARAPWRDSYPGRPWQQLVAGDRRLRLIDEIYIADSSFRRPLDIFFPDEQEEARRAEEDLLLLDQIAAFQAELLASRRAHASEGLWNGEAPRASTARVIFDTQAGSSTIVYLEPVDALKDHTATIDENLAQGGYDSADWGFELDDEDDDLGADLDGLPGLDEIGDLHLFMEQNPALAAAAQKLMSALTPDEVDRLQRVETAEDAQQILANRFQYLLRDDPSLFATLAPYTPEEPQTEGNGNGHYEASLLDGDDEGWEGDDLDEEEWGEESWDEAIGEEDSSASEEALEHSNELMERFYQHLLRQGKSESTASARTGDLWVYADFLANYYSRSLDAGDYATLDECLFFFYPRKVINSSPRAAREMCTSIKQFYAFLSADGLADDQFAQAMWRRRDQAARVVELYESIDSDSPQFERLFAHLFAPYTV